MGTHGPFVGECDAWLGGPAKTAEGDRLLGSTGPVGDQSCCVGCGEPHLRRHYKPALAIGSDHADRLDQGQQYLSTGCTQRDWLGYGDVRLDWYIPWSRYWHSQGHHFALSFPRGPNVFSQTAQQAQRMDSCRQVIRSSWLVIDPSAERGAWKKLNCGVWVLYYWLI